MSDVLIVGAGPVGLMLAAELTRHGVSVRLVETRTTVASKSKAMSIHARTMEIFGDLGIAERFMDAGNRIGHACLYAGTDRLAKLSIEGMDSPYPFILTLPQYETERLLAEHLASLGGQIERGIEMTDMVPDATGVAVTLRRDEGEEEARFGWVVCCDGAHSLGRKLLGIPYEGEDLDIIFTLADVRVEWDGARDEYHNFFTAEGSMGLMAMPEPNRWRLFATISGTTLDELPPATLEYYRALAAERFPPEITLHDPVWMAHFALHQRKVDQYRKGRVVLAGDAAHCHAPVGGQGMNTGLQDAYNLAWKLALVVRGLGRTELLDSYETEREAIATELLKESGQSTRIAALRNPITQELRNQFYRWGVQLDVVEQRVVHALGMLTLNYRGSPLVAEDQSSVLQTSLGGRHNADQPRLDDWNQFRTAPSPGDRAPDAPCVVNGAPSSLYAVFRGTRHCLLLFGSEASEASAEQLGLVAADISRHYAGLIDVHFVQKGDGPPPAAHAGGSVLCDTAGKMHEHYGAGAPCLYLIRPDNYIGYRSLPPDLDKLRAYLGRVFVG